MKHISAFLTHPPLCLLIIDPRPPEIPLQGLWTCLLKESYGLRGEEIRGMVIACYLISSSFHFI